MDRTQVNSMAIPQPAWMGTGVVTLLLALLMALVLTLAPAARAQETVVSGEGKTADEAVKEYIALLLDRLEDIRGLYSSDRDQYFEEIAVALEDFVDFREVARGVMARYSTGPRGASAEQLDRFAEVFKQSMVDFYGSALTTYGGGDYQIQMGRSSSNPAENTNVRMLVRSPDGGRIELVYTMFLDDNDKWRLKNVLVEGVNLRRQYHSQFDNLMNRHNFDIDAVIDSWSAEVQL